MSECPSCGRQWPAGRESCGACLATLVEDADATVTCPECGRVCPARMQSCPGCLALLRPEEVDLTEDLARALSAGIRLHRPASRPPFDSGPGCELLRLSPRGGLVLCGVDGLVEANLEGPGIAARPPLTCRADGSVLFRLVDYPAADRGLVAIGADGAAIATYLRTGGLLSETFDVRDETSAPVARFEPVPGGVGYHVVDTHGRLLATVARTEVEVDLWADDQWSLSPRAADLPLQPLALVALLVAAKAFLGRAEPAQVADRERRRWDEPDQLEDTLGPIGRSIVEDWLD